MDNVKKNQFDYRHVICILITLVFVLLAIFYFKYSHLRLFESIIDLWNSLVYYVDEMFECSFDANVTVNNLTKTPYKLPFHLPNSWNEFKDLLNSFIDLFFTKRNFLLYLKKILISSLNIARFITLALPLWLIYLLCKKKESNNDWNKDSKALIKFKLFQEKIILPVKNWIIDFINFVIDHKIYKTIWLLIWAYNFQILTIAVEFIAFYLYFIVSFDFLNIYRQIIKLLMDLSVMIKFIPFIVWCLIGYLILDYYRKKIGYSNLSHMEARNGGMVEERSKVIFIDGSMGTGKTKELTDMALTMESKLRSNAFKKILECDLKFPFFPWIIFERFLKKEIKRKNLYNLASIKRCIRSMTIKFYNSKDPNDPDHKRPDPRKIFNYDYLKYGLYYNDGLEINDIWKILEDYAQLYFIYIIKSSLIISNYSIRSDNILEDLNNFPLWNLDFFQRDPVYQNVYSRHSHILDYDMLRLGKSMIKDSEKVDAFEFGIIVVTEIGKERGNAIELQGIKKIAVETNQKNDFFNNRLKLIRHSATIDHYCFAQVFVDDQRPESWGADARDLCELVHIEETSEIRLAMPFFALEDLIIQLLFDKFKDTYYDHRFYRGDNTLIIYLFKSIFARLYHYYKKIYNTFGYYEVNNIIEKGTQKGSTLDRKYYLMFKKIYSNRYSTDCFNDFFVKKALRSKIGLNDFEEYQSTNATLEELEKQNSYFVNGLDKMTSQKEDIKVDDIHDQQSDESEDIIDLFD